MTATRGYIPELDLEIVLRPGEAHLHEAYAPPDRRGQGAFGLVLDFIFRALQVDGFTRTYSYVRGDQPERLAGAARRLRPVGQLSYLRVCGRSLLLGMCGEEALPVLVSRMSAERLS